MAPKNEAEFAKASDSEDEKSSGSDSDSGSGSGSDSGSGSKSEAESVASKASSGSKSSKSSSVRSGHSGKSGRSAASARSAQSSRSNHSRDKNQSRSRSQSPSRSRSRSVSGTPVHSDSEGDEKLVLDVPKSGSASPMSAKSASSNASSKSSQKKTENQKATNKRKHLVLSDDESQSDKDDKEGDRGEGATAEALFGEAGDISSEEENDEGKKNKISDDEKEDKEEKDKSPRDEEMEKEDDRRDNDKEKEPEEVVPETRIEHEIPYIRADVGKEFHFVKLPNFLSMEPRPFDPQTYEDEIDEEETLDEEGRARLKLKVENTIRWRTNFDKDGNAIQESNARMVRWSDGSLSLYLGSEVFDVYRQPLQGDHNHLFIRQGTGLQGQAVFRTKLTFRPHSTDSFTHRKMTLSLADRSQKTSAIKILGNVGSDPELNRAELLKKEEERLRASMRRESKQKRIRERTATGRGLSGSYLEPDRRYEDSEDEGTISLAAIKKQFKRGEVRPPPIYSSEEDASDIESRKAKKLERAKVIHDSDEEEEAAASSSKARVLSDDSDEDSD